MQNLINKIVCGDCVEILGHLSEPFADLIFADPPFNIGYQYDKYKDVLEKDKYIAWTKDWMAACVNVLKPAGSFYIAIGDDYAANVRIIGDQLGLTLRNWIIWHYTFGQQTKLKFARSHTHIFYFTKNPADFTFNDYTVRVPSDRQLTYNDKRANPAGKLPDDVWSDFSRVCGTFKERQGWHPCQMPEVLLARIVSVSSNPDDVVVDPFNGSGTTTAVACRLNRRYVGVDISEQYVEKAGQRIAEIIETKGKSDSLFGGLNGRSLLEIKRLYAEMGIAAEQILANRQHFKLFKRQLALRLNNGDVPAESEIAVVLKELSFGR